MRVTIRVSFPGEKEVGVVTAEYTGAETDPTKVIRIVEETLRAGGIHGTAHLLSRKGAR